MMTSVPNPGHANDKQDAHVKTPPSYGPVFFAAMAVLFLALFVLNACTHGTTLGLASTGLLAVLMGYRAYRTWSTKRRGSLH